MDTAHLTQTSLEYLDQFNLLPLNVPTDFIKVLGCLCITEFVGFYPNDLGNAMVYDNGFWEDEIDTELWSSWATQSHVASHLHNIHFSTESGIFSALVVNVVTRDIYEADEVLAREFLYRYYVDSKGLPRT